MRHLVVNLCIILNYFFSLYRSLADEILDELYGPKTPIEENSYEEIGGRLKPDWESPSHNPVINGKIYLHTLIILIVVFNVILVVFTVLVFFGIYK